MLSEEDLKQQYTNFLEVTELLKRNCDNIDLAASELNTLIASNPNYLECIFSNGGSNCLDQYGLSLLHIICNPRWVQPNFAIAVIDKLITCPSFELVSSAHETCLMVASSNPAGLELVKFLVSKGADKLYKS